MVGARVPDVYEDRVVLCRPAALRAATVVIGPDDLVQERLAPEDLIEQQLAVVRLPVVDVEVERSLEREQPARVRQARLQELQIVLEVVAVARLRKQPGAVAPPLKAGPRPLAVTNGAQRPACLGPAGVERRIDVDHLKGRIPQRGQELQVLAQQDAIRRLL